jgi:PST family polysaccharide transporter
MKSQAKNLLLLRYLPVRIRRLLEDKAGLLAAIHNFGWIFSEKIIRGVLGVLVGAWVARYLGPSEFGELSYAIAFITIFQAIANLGLDGIVVREVVNNIERANMFWGPPFDCVSLLVWHVGSLHLSFMV